MLSWGLSNGLKFPLDQYFGFFVMGFALLLSVVLAFMLPETINSRKKATSETVEENERN